MLTASSEPCFGTDRKVASGSRENHAFCEDQAVVLLDFGVIRFTRRRAKIGLHEAASRCNLVQYRAFLGVHLGDVG